MRLGLYLFLSLRIANRLRKRKAEKNYKCHKALFRSFPISASAAPLPVSTSTSVTFPSTLSLYKWADFRQRRERETLSLTQMILRRSIGSFSCHMSSSAKRFCPLVISGIQVGGPLTNSKPWLLLPVSSSLNQITYPLHFVIYSGAKWNLIGTKLVKLINLLFIPT